MNHRWILPTLTLLLVACVLPGASVAADPAPPKGKVQLFNGTDLTGWKAEPELVPQSARIWSAQEGVIRCLGQPKCYLRTVGDYTNYHLHVSWRWSGKPGNSGVFIHGSGPEKVWPHCYEAQLLAGNAGELRANGGSKFHENSAPTDRSIPKLAASSERPAGEWNDYDIDCVGKSVTVTVNGVLQNRLENADSSSGWIGLQAEGGVIEFKDITLARLNP